MNEQQSIGGFEYSNFNPRDIVQFGFASNFVENVTIAKWQSDRNYKTAGFLTT